MKLRQKLLLFTALWLTMTVLLFQEYIMSKLFQKIDSADTNTVNLPAFINQALKINPSKNPTYKESNRNSITRTPANVLSMLNLKLPNLPVLFINSSKNFKLNKTCAWYPSLSDINYSNVYWQQQGTSNGTYFLYSAFLVSIIHKRRHIVIYIDGSRAVVV